MNPEETMRRQKDMTASMALVEASRCLFCYDAPCSHACPLRVDVAGFVRRLATGNLQGAVALIRERNVLAEVCGYLCPTEVFCERACGRSVLDRPVAIGALQAFVARHERGCAPPAHPGASARSPQRVAVVGAGPGGLGTAVRLLQLGYSVEVFERRALPGGQVTYAVPPHRLEKEVMLFEVRLLEEAGAAFHMGIEVDDPGELLETFDAVVVATGPGEPRHLGIEGEDLEGVYSADAF